MKNDMIKVKWLKAHHAFAYSAGNIGSVTPDAAAKLLKGGYIMLLPADEDEPPANPLPEDLPGRDVLFESGFDTIEKVKKAGDSLLDTGISGNTLKRVKSYLKDK